MPPARAPLAATLALAALALAGCTVLRPLDDLQAGSDGGGGDGGGAGGCPVGMARAGAVDFCVDSIEVTNQDYQAFVTRIEQAPGGGLPTDGPCSWKRSFRPRNFPPRPDQMALPVAEVDWCDAVAFCASQQKRLCGALGGAALDFREFANPRASQWQNACSGGGALTFPYGNAFDATQCNGGAEGGGGAAPRIQPVAPLRCPGKGCCEGGYPGLFDLSGNVAEWEDACEGGAGESGFCRVRGGSFRNRGTTTLRCTADEALRRDTRREDVGFRCCTR